MTFSAAFFITLLVNQAAASGIKVDARLVIAQTSDDGNGRITLSDERALKPKWKCDRCVDVMSKALASNNCKKTCKKKAGFINQMKKTKCKNMCNYAKNNAHTNKLQSTARGACDKKRFCEEGFPTFASDTLKVGDWKTWVAPQSKKNQPGNELYTKFAVEKYSCALTANSPIGHMHCSSAGINYFFRGRGEQVTVKVEGPLRNDDCGGPLEVYKLSGALLSPFYCFTDGYYPISKTEINWVAEAGVDYIVQVSGIDDGSFEILVEENMPSIIPWYVPWGVPSSIPANMPSSIPTSVK